MSMVVLVLGTLLAFGGAVALYSGYGNVEAVRGWTAVIAGTTALSVGVMTIGIAFVLRCLVRVQAALEIERRLMPLLNEIALTRDADDRGTRSAGGQGAIAPGAQPAALVTAATFRVDARAGDKAGSDAAFEPRSEARLAVAGNSPGTGIATAVATGMAEKAP
jgi:hypothetical protein